MVQFLASEDGQDWPSGKRSANKGRTLAGGPYAFCQIRADWRGYIDLYGMKAGWNMKQVCHRCKAQMHGPDRWTRWTHFEHFEKRSHANFILNILPRYPSPLTCIIGYHVMLNRWCMMHTVNLGIAQWVNAACALLLSGSGKYGAAVPDADLSRQLNALYIRFRAWGNAAGIAHSQPRFTLQMVRGSALDFAEFSHKAYNGRVLLVFFTAALAELRSHSADDMLMNLTLGAVQSLNEYMTKCEEYPIYLNQEQADHLKSIGQKFLGIYYAASSHCRELNLLWFPLRPKLHEP